MHALSNLLSLAWRLVLRDWRSGELNILLASLIIAIAGTCTVTLLGHRLTRTVESQAAEFLAADLAITAHEPLPSRWIEQASAAGLDHASTVEFPSVIVEHEQLLLCGIKAVSERYPLRGSLTTSTGTADQGMTTPSGPPPGEAWVDQRVLTTLGLKLGDTVTVGELPLRIGRLLIRLPDSRGDLFGLSPPVLINLADLAGTKVIQPGSHAHYYSLFAGAEAELRRFKAELKGQLNVGQRLVDIHEDRPELGKALSRTERYLGLSSIVIVVIAGVAIAMSARRYTVRHYDLTAMFKCLGASQVYVFSQHLLQYLMIGLTAGIAGTALGYGVQYLVVEAMKRILPRELSPPSWEALAFGPVIGLAVLLGFALPTMLRVKYLPPLRVLRRDLEPIAASGWLVYGLAGGTIAALTWSYTGDSRLTAWVLGVSSAAILVAGLVSYFMVRTIGRSTPGVRLEWRYGMQNLARNPPRTTGQILAFCVTLSAMLLILLVRTELITDWRRQLPDDVPNYFALNVLQADLQPFRDFLASHRISSSPAYPIVRGRLTQINGTEARRLASRESEGEAAINRDLNLTYGDSIPEENRIVEGKWWENGGTDPQVSIEQKLAKSLGLRLGDRLTFNIADRTVTASVTSIRSLRWDTMKPNFYVIFNPGVLDSFPRTYLSSFHLDDGQQSILVNMVRDFPAVTVLQLDALLKQLMVIVEEVTLAVELVLAFALAAGFAVLGSTARASLDERIREHALLRSLGANRSMLRKNLLIEFGSLGFLAGFMAAILTELLVWVLFHHVFEMEARIHWQVWLAAPLGGAIAIGLSGYWFTRRAVNQSPLVVLREC